MRYDLAPLYRSTIGFDRLFNMLDQYAGVDNTNAYPPYNIERTGENDYRITLAVAGFGPADLTIEQRENTLAIRGGKSASVEGNGAQNVDEAAKPAVRQVLHQGIAGRAFERRFQLADHVQVKGASLENGLLHVDLVREIPEAAKPRRIPIGQSAGQSTGEAKLVNAGPNQKAA